jgi:hypothetical protein
MSTRYRPESLKGQATWRQEEAASDSEWNPYKGSEGIPRKGSLPRRTLQGEEGRKPGCAGRGEGLRRQKGKSGSGRPKVEYPEVGLRIAQAAQNPEAGPRLRRELALVAKDLVKRKAAKA